MGEYKIEEPSNEMQVREWFVAHIAESEYSVIVSQSAFPDFILIDGNGDKVRAEFEHKSGNFVSHGHPVDGCDLVVCWSHNLDLPLPVLELSNETLHRPNEGAVEDKYTSRRKKRERPRPEDTLREVVKKCPEEMEALTNAMVDDLHAMDQWLTIVQEPRLALFSAQVKMVQALRETGGEDALRELGKLHPHNLFEILTSKVYLVK